MGTVFKIAFRNVLRNKRRTILTGLTTMFGIFFFIFMDSIMSGMDRGSIQNQINYSDSSLKIQTRAYHDEEQALPLEFGITNYNETKAFLEKQKFVEGATRRSRFIAEASVYENSFKAMGVVMDPATDDHVFRMKTIVAEGSYFTGDGKGQVLIGKQMASDLGIGVGDSLVVASRTKYGAQNAVDLDIVGILNSSDPQLNGSTVLITYAEANDFLDLEGLITEMDVRVKWDKGMSLSKYLKRIDGVRDAFKAKYKGFSLLTFREIGAALVALVQQKMAAGYIFLFFMLLIAAVGIFNSVLMSIYERIREIGVLKALGFQPKEITRIFMLEGFFIGVIGSLMGLIFGALLNIYLVNVGYNVAAMTKGVDTTGFPMWGIIYGQWNPVTFVWVFVFGVAVAVIAARIPAKKAAKMSATHCLRFV